MSKKNGALTPGDLLQKAFAMLEKVEYPTVFVSFSLDKKNDVKTDFEVTTELPMKKQKEAKDPRVEMIADAVGDSNKRKAKPARKLSSKYTDKNNFVATTADVVLESRHPPKGNKSPW